MKFCLVTETFPPEINGVAMTLEKLILGIAKRGIDTNVVRPKQKKEDNKAKQAKPYKEHLVTGMPIPRYPEMRFGLPCGGFLKKLWTQDRPDIVHVATEGPLGLSAINVSKKLGIKTISSFHTNFHSYGGYYAHPFVIKAVLRYLKYFHNKTSATFVPDPKLQKTLEMEGFNNVKILSRGVDTKLFGPHHHSEKLRASWSAGAKDTVMVYVGRIAQEKNLDKLIHIYQELKKTNASLSLVMVGDGPYRSTIETKHPEIHFCGSKRGIELAEHYASGDIFIFPSTTETFGNVVTEAMASALPVVAFDYAAPQQFIKHNQNGFLVPFDDDDAMMRQALDAFDMRDRWDAIGCAARKRMESVSWDTVIDRFIGDLSTIIPQKEQSSPELILL